jgi:CHAD domain-containing protein
MPKVTAVPSHATAADVLGPLWRAQVTELRASDADLRLGRPDAVHRFRVAARRLRSSLAGFEPLIDATATRRIKEDLREAAAAVSGARDADVMRRRVDSLLADEPDTADLARTRDRLRGLLDATYQESWQLSGDYLDSPAYDDLTRALDRFSDIPSWSSSAHGPAEEVFAPLLAHEWDRFQRRGRQALVGTGGDVDEERMHDVRKAAKRMRYVAESLRPVFGRRAKQQAKAGRRVQGVLGDYQDAAITRSLLEQATRDALLDGDDVTLLHRMLARETAAAAVLHAEFVQLFRESERTALRRWIS